MSNFLHGLGGGLGRGIGRAIGIIVVGFLIYFIISILDVDIKNDILSRVLMLDVSAKEQTSDLPNSVISTPYNSQCGSGGTGYCAITTSNTFTRRSLNNTYNGVLSGIEFDFTYTMNTSYQYTLNIKAMSTDFRNNNIDAYVCGYNAYPNQCTYLNTTLTFIDKSLIQIKFPNQTYTHYSVYLSGSPLTGISTYGIKKLYLTYEDGTVDNSDIINNQNSNTSDIINNANNNTQDLISQVQDLIANNEELTQNIINGMSCPTGPLALTRSNFTYIDGKYLNSSGEQLNANGYAISYYVELKPNTQYKFEILDSVNAPSVCYYYGKSTSQLISCTQYARNSVLNVTTPNANGVVYALFSLASRGVTVTGPVCNDWQREAEQLLNQTQTETNDLIKDDSVDQSQANSFFNDFDDDDHGLASIVTLPLTTIQSLTSEQCVVLQLPVPFTNEHFTLPCMSQIYQEKVPALYNLWQIVCYGLIGYWIATDIFKLVKEFKDPEQDKVEVMDL